MRDYFTYAGVNSRDFGVVIQRRPAYVVPEKIVETFSVRGRSGDLVIDTGAYSNTTRTYEIFVPHENRSAFVNWIKGQVGYQSLWDTYEPEYYRMAMYTPSLTIDNVFAQFGTATIEFNCKPMRYLMSGRDPILIDTSGTVLNNVGEVSTPAWSIVGSGDVTFSINNNSLIITGITDFIACDADTQNCFKGTTNLNNTVSLGATGKFPVLEKGANTISWTGNVSYVNMYPRWWKL